MSPQARGIVAVIAGMAGAAITTHLLGTYLHLPVVLKSMIMLLAAGIVIVLILYLATRGSNGE